MRAFIVYKRKKGMDVSYHPWASTEYIDLKVFVDCVVLAQTHKEAAELLGLGVYYVEEHARDPRELRYRNHKSHTVQIPRVAFALATEDNERWGELVRGGYDNLLVFDRGLVHLFIEEGRDKVILQIDELPLVQPALVAS